MTYIQQVYTYQLNLFCGAGGQTYNTLRLTGYTESFEMVVGVLTTATSFYQMQPHVISFYGVTSRIGFMFLLFPQVFRN